VHAASATNRRSFLAGFLGFPWFPFLRKPEKRIAGIRFRIYRRGESARRWIHVHGNEVTARQTMEEHLHTQAGVALGVLNDQRNVRIGNLAIDPNRFFSRVGAEASLRRLNTNAVDAEIKAVLDRLDKDREKFVASFLPPAGGILIALHNNGPTYSVHDETPISDEMALNDPEHPRDFLLTTSKSDFALLRNSPWNVVLQDLAPKDDDGSLSRLCQRIQVRYVNIEAAAGNLNKQRDMLIWTTQHLPALFAKPVIHS
jgi:hypothetical protein